MSVNLQYNYAQIDVTTGVCVSCATTSYEINHPAFIEVPQSSDDYIGKYYHEGYWYIDPEFTVLAEGLN